MVIKLVLLIAAYIKGLHSENGVVIAIAIAYLAIGGLGFTAMGFMGNGGILSGIIGITMILGAGHVFFYHRM